MGDREVVEQKAACVADDADSEGRSPGAYGAGLDDGLGAWDPADDGERERQGKARGELGGDHGERVIGAGDGAGDDDVEAGREDAADNQGVAKTTSVEAACGFHD